MCPITDAGARAIIDACNSADTQRPLFGPGSKSFPRNPVLEYHTQRFNARWAGRIWDGRSQVMLHAEVERWAGCPVRIEESFGDYGLVIDIAILGQ